MANEKERATCEAIHRAHAAGVPIDEAASFMSGVLCAYQAITIAARDGRTMSLPEVLHETSRFLEEQARLYQN